ncbi:MAG: hypothetical protein KDD47_26770, partial [Acidobacteria bacterium]|nr:hypothetical protein [Acidobacteriota bacterium]
MLLYRPGTYEPELILPANQPAELPSGTWHWLDQAPGFVSVVGGSLNAPREGPPLRKNIVWPVVPACELDLSEASWGGVERLDAVSLERQAVFPVAPQKRTSLWIPAGRFLAYTVGARGIQAVSAIRRCEVAQT